MVHVVQRQDREASDKVQLGMVPSEGLVRHLSATSGGYETSSCVSGSSDEITEPRSDLSGVTVPVRLSFAI